MKIKNPVFFLLYICISLHIQSQSFDIYHESIILNDVNYNITGLSTSSFHKTPKSVKIENDVNELLDPIIKLNSSEKLTLKFDILTSEANTYAYTFIHCNSKWEYSNIIQSDYLEGFFDHYINNYQYSFNTLAPYVHYECSFPNEDINFKKSGNYIILVYDAEKNIPIITKKFMIYEELVDISMTVKKPTLAKDRNNKQEIDFQIQNYQNLNITDPGNELQIIIQKNDDWNDVIMNCKPNFINNKVLDYDYQGALSFLGGNEYRDFDIKSLRYLGKNIKSIEQKRIQGSQIHYVEITEDYTCDPEHYEFKYDLNGKYVLSISETKDKNTEGDYALVKFTLNNSEITNEDIYIYGELTNWNILPEAKMNYNKQDNHYYGFLYLKQGYYNYQYIIPFATQKKTHPIEGEYSETRNQYSIYVYHTPVWGDYDRLVGIAKSTSNSLN